MFSYYQHLLGLGPKVALNLLNPNNKTAKKPHLRSVNILRSYQVAKTSSYHKKNDEQLFRSIRRNQRQIRWQVQELGTMETKI